MSKIRSWKAINTEAMTDTSNTLICISGDSAEYMTHSSKPEDKAKVLNDFADGLAVITTLLFVWTGKTRSDVFDITIEDANRILGKTPKITDEKG